MKPSQPIAEIQTIPRSEASAEPNGKPRSGIYFVVASFNREGPALTFIARNTSKKSLAARVLACTAKGRTVFRVAVGPVTKPDRPVLRARLSEAGFKGSWPLTFKAPRERIEFVLVE